MEKNNHTQIKIIFFFAVIFLTVLSVFSYIKIKKLVEISRWVNHTNVVKLNLANTFTVLLEMETNMRGYIITKDSSFLKPFYSNAAVLDISLTKIDSLTHDNKTQQLSTSLLKTLVSTRKNYMQSILNDTLTQKIKPGKKKLRGKKLMDDVRNQINKMESQEDDLLNERTQQLNKETYLTPITTICLILSSVFILIASYYKIIKDLKIADTLKYEVEKTNEELKVKNEELKKKEEHFLKIFDNNPVALTFGEIGTNKIIYANKLFYAYFGYTEAEVIGHTSDELHLVSPEENARLLPIILSYLEENRSVEELRALPVEETEKLLIKLREKMFGNGFEVLYTKKSRDTFSALVFYEVIEIGNKKYTLTSYQDVTERKKTERKVEKQNEELLVMNKELESFNYVSSHDLQEPLRKIQVFSSQIIEKDYDKLSDKGKDLFQRIQDSAQKMQTLIKDLLSYSRTNAAERTFENIDIKKIITEVEGDLKEEILQKQATIEVGQIDEVKVIPFQFRQLIYNLISNSLKFSKVNRPPVIKINAEIKQGVDFNSEKLVKETKYYHLNISDNGIGFEPQYSEKIFEVFQRLHRKNEYSGTGIGLAIVKKIVDNHNGLITAHGEPDKGVTFNIYIPVT